MACLNAAAPRSRQRHRAPHKLDRACQVRVGGRPTAPPRGQSTSGRLVARLLPLMRATEGRFRAVLESRPRATPQPCAREVIHYHSYLIEIWLFSAVFRYIMGTWTAREVRTGSSAITCCTYGSSEPMSERISAISGRGGSPVSHKQDIFGFECVFWGKKSDMSTWPGKRWWAYRVRARAGVPYIGV